MSNKQKDDRYNRKYDKNRIVQIKDEEFTAKIEINQGHVLGHLLFSIVMHGGGGMKASEM